MQQPGEGSDSENAEEPLDPAIQIELERLNRCGEEINMLESDYTRIKREVETFREESKQRLTKLDEKIGRKRLLQAQPYYDAVRDGNNAKSLLETHQRNLAHILDELEAAREMLSRTEQELVAEGINDELREMHQQSARKLETVVERKADIEQQIAQARSRLGDRAAKARVLLRTHPRAIERSRPYFEALETVCEELERRFSAQRTTNARIRALKRDYADALRRLEAISSRIHAERERERLKRRQSSCAKSETTESLKTELREKRGSVSLILVAEQMSRTSSVTATLDVETVSRAIVPPAETTTTSDGTADGETNCNLANNSHLESTEEAVTGLQDLRVRLAKMNVKVVSVDDVDSTAESDADGSGALDTTGDSFGDLVGYSSAAALESTSLSNSASVAGDLDSDTDAASLASFSLEAPSHSVASVQQIFPLAADSTRQETKAQKMQALK